MRYFKIYFLLLIILTFHVSVISAKTWDSSHILKDVRLDISKRLEQKYPSFIRETLRIEVENDNELALNIPLNSVRYSLDISEKDPLLKRVFVRIKFYGEQDLFLKQYTLFLKVFAKGDFVVTTRKIYPREILHKSDLMYVELRLYNKSGVLISDMNSVLGKEAHFTIQENTELMLWMVKDKAIIRQGDAVMIDLFKKGITIATSGSALEDGSMGSVIKVRTKNNKILFGKVVNEKNVTVNQDS